MNISHSLARLWGKSAVDHNGTLYNHNSLLGHLLSVAAVASVIFDHPISKRQLARLHATEAKPLLILIVALHDLGKISPYFQLRVGRPYDSITFDHPDELETRTQREQEAARYYHGERGLVEYAPRVSQHLATTKRDQKILNELLFGVCAHHGYYPEAESSNSRRLAAERLPSEQLALELSDVLKAVVAPDTPMHCPNLDEGRFIALTHWISGWTVLADWIGSEGNTFEPLTTERLLNTYNDTAQLQAIYRTHQELARQRLAQLGVFQPAATDTARDYPSILASVLARRGFQLNQMQEWACTQPLVSGPTLIICEVPMGAGKTEFATLISSRAISEGHAQGLAFAMPTQGSSNQVHKRLDEAFSERLFQWPAALTHSSAKWRLNDDRSNSGGDSSRNDKLGFLCSHTKRAFLAPVSVVTVDQIELGVLNSKHSFLRAAALSRHIVVIDEIHAYDSYMSELLDQALAFLARFHTPVVLLSATLPHHVRSRFLNAYAAAAGLKPVPQTPAVDYPRITWLNDGQVNAIHLDQQPATLHTLQIKTLNSADITAKALAFAANGECVCILCNSVASAHQRFQDLIDATRNSDIKVQLFHARFTQTDRQEVEARILSQFDKDSTTADRRHRIVVATQVIEQSLDLDFDHMLTELAPIDLLMQRMGRLHRHPRPYRTCTPVLHIIMPTAEDSAKNTVWYRNTRTIYSDHTILDATQKWVEQHLNTSLPLPVTIGTAINEVYDSYRPSVKNQSLEASARDRCFSFTEPRPKLLSRQISVLARSSKTRPGDPSRRVLITFQVTDKLYVDCQQPLEISHPKHTGGKLSSSHLDHTALHCVSLTENPNPASRSLFNRLIAERMAVEPTRLFSGLSRSLADNLPYDYILVGTRIESDGLIRIYFGSLDDKELYYDNLYGLILQKKESSHAPA